MDLMRCFIRIFLTNRSIFDASTVFIQKKFHWVQKLSFRHKTVQFVVQKLSFRYKNVNFFIQIYRFTILLLYNVKKYRFAIKMFDQSINLSFYYKSNWLVIQKLPFWYKFHLTFKNYRFAKKMSNFSINFIDLLICYKKVLSVI